jgi:very-short-patch-repair endonuclease
VITFNEPQRDLIDDRVEARRTSSEDFDRLYSLANRAELDLDVRPFVKNIENVQGDERDAIIFSVGYAPDRQGKFRVQFGSLNQEGGENRLNVAITRAKERVIMVASFDPSQLPVEGAKNAGPVRLKEYLLYAKAVAEKRGDEIAQLLRKLDAAVAAPPSASTIAEFDAPLEAQVRAALEALGFKVESQVGFSGYRIDLAVVDPKDDSRYVIGIECDGVTFQSAKSARERDVGRQRFLEDRGWSIERVWSRNWWRDRPGEIARLQRRIQELSKERKPEEKAKTVAPIAPPKPTMMHRAPEDIIDQAPDSVPDVLAAGASLPDKDDRSMRFIFFKQLEARTFHETDAAKAILDWADGSEMRLWWREVGGVTTVTPYFKHGGIAHWSFSLRADGAVDLYFQYLKAPFDEKARRLELIRRLNSIPSVSIPEEYVGKTRTLLLSALSSEEELDGFIRTMQWYENEVKRQ